MIKFAQALSTSEFADDEEMLQSEIEKLLDATSHRVREWVSNLDVLVLWKTPMSWEFRGNPDPASVQILVPVHVAREQVRKQMDDQLLWVQVPLNLGVASMRSSSRTSR